MSGALKFDVLIEFLLDLQSSFLQILYDTNDLKVMFTFAAKDYVRRFSIKSYKCLIPLFYF